MKHLLSFIFLYFIFLQSFGQNKLILHGAFGREVIREGKVIGITLKGEPYRYQNWKKVYKCDHNIQQNLWVVDSIGTNKLYLIGYNYHVSVEHQKVVRKDINKLKNKEYVIDTVIKSNRKATMYDTLVVGIISLDYINEKYRAVEYSDIESLTFSHWDARKKIRDRGLLIGNFNGTSGDPRVDAVVLIVVLSIDLTVCVSNYIVNELETLVKTYNLSDWKYKVKTRLPSTY